MKLYAPKYYKEFACIADKCRHSCCVGWEIDVDGEALKTYKTLDGYGKEIVKSIDYCDAPHFKLAENDRCPHLNGRGLCRIILELGEEYLCDICREHPRFYNNTAHGREVGIGMACEEACRIILNSDEYAEIVEVGEAVGMTESAGFDAISHRAHIYLLLADIQSPYTERLRKIREAYGADPSKISDCEWKKLIGSLEYLDGSHKEMFSAYSSSDETPSELEKLLERAFAYFVFRHCSEARDEMDFRAALGLSLFCERLLASVVKNGECGVEATLEAARIISEEIEYSEDNTETVKYRFF